jgi:hypothetical protein
MRKIEAVADAIASLNEYSGPSSKSYRLRNPGLLKAKTLEHLASATDECLRVFTCHQAGYKALTDILQKSFERNRRSTLQQVLSDHGHGDQFSVAAAVDFISRSLDTREVSGATQLHFFLE